MKTLADLLAAREENKTEMQSDFDAVFGADKDLQKSIQNAECFEDGFYQIDMYGMLEYHTTMVADADYSPCIDEFKTYLQENYCLSLGNEGHLTYLTVGCGDDFYSISDDGPHNAGSIVFQGNREIASIPNSDSLDDLYEAIESDMEKQGCFPEVIRQGERGDVEMDTGYHAWLKKRNSKESKQ